MISRDIILTRLDEQAHSADALDLAMRAADYVTLEVGHAPDEAFIRDFFYKLFARNRYALFGHTDQCMVPADDVKERFIGF